MTIHGYVGIAIIVLAEVALFSGNRLVGEWFTPIVWTGFILLMDALVFKVHRRSLLVTDRLEFLIIAVVSIASWWLFELYNAPRFWRSDLELWWHYHNLTPNPFLRRVGYDWAFATIFPAMFLTAQLLTVTVFKKLRSFTGPGRSAPGSVRSSFPPLGPGRSAPGSVRTVAYLLIFIGAVTAVIPLIIISTWFAPTVWLAFIFLLDPINYLRGWPSIIGDVQQGSYRRLFALLSAGGICGVLWEFWNYWALSRWTYTVPYFGDVKIFEMPILGYLGFPPFAVECWVMYIFCRSLLTQKPVATGNIWVET